MALTFFWRCEGTTLDATHDLSAGDSSATAQGAVSISSSSPLVGSNSIVVGGAGQHYRFNSGGMLDPANGSMSGVFEITTFGNNATLVAIFGADANNFIQVNMVGTDELALRIGTATGPVSAAITTTDANLVTGQRYAYVARWHDATNYRRLEVYDTDGVLLDAVEDTATNWVAPTELNGSDRGRLGEATGNAGAFKLDNVACANTFDEPLEDNLFITSYTQYNGGSASTTLQPAQATLTLNGRLPSVNTFTAVAIREVLINEAGSPVTNRTGMHLMVWYAGVPAGAPDLSLTALTTDAAGTASWSLPPGSLIYNQPIFYLAHDGSASLSNYTCARMIPTYT